MAYQLFYLYIDRKVTEEVYTKQVARRLQYFQQFPEKKEKTTTFSAALRRKWLKNAERAWRQVPTIYIQESRSSTNYQADLSSETSVGH